MGIPEEAGLYGFFLGLMVFGLLYIRIFHIPKVWRPGWQPFKEFCEEATRREFYFDPEHSDLDAGVIKLYSGDSSIVCRKSTLGFICEIDAQLKTSGRWILQLNAKEDVTRIEHYGSVFREPRLDTQQSYLLNDAVSNIKRSVQKPVA